MDSKLRVHGVRNLRIADASVIPVIPDCRIQNSVYMIGEKVSTVIHPLSVSQILTFYRVRISSRLHTRISMVLRTLLLSPASCENLDLLCGKLLIGCTDSYNNFLSLISRFVFFCPVCVSLCRFWIWFCSYSWNSWVIWADELGYQGIPVDSIRALLAPIL